MIIICLLFQLDFVLYVELRGCLFLLGEVRVVVLLLTLVKVLLFISLRGI